jgi:hypothetical protein
VFIYLTGGGNRSSRRGGSLNRVSAFTFFSIKISVKAACFEEEIYRKVEKVEEKGKKEKNHGRARTERTSLVSNIYFAVLVCVVCGCFEFGITACPAGFSCRRVRREGVRSAYGRGSVFLPPYGYS